MIDKKIFFVDLDGTLLNDKKEVTPLTLQAIHDYVENGNLFAICTGRPLFSAKGVYQQLGLPTHNCYIVAFNGSEIYDCENDKVLLRYSITNDFVEKALDLADEYGIYVQAYSDDSIICRKITDCTLYYTGAIRMNVIETPNVTQALVKPTCKLLIVELTDQNRLKRYCKAVKELGGDAIQILKSNEFYTEIFSSETGKGIGLQKLCEYLNIPIENSIGAGDEQNDISMLQAVGLSIAMKNGNPNVKAVADIITENDNNHDGLVPYFQ